MAYDRIDWHSGGEYPTDLPPENGGIHIGMFLAWAFAHGMAGGFHHEESAHWLEQLQRRRITGLDFLLQACDGKFWEDDLDDEGNAFAIDYYRADSAFARQHGSYLDDYCDVFNRHAEANGFEYESTYHVENTWENFDRIAPVLDRRHAQWQAWREQEGNRALDPKVQFQQACIAVGDSLSACGFKPNKDGTTWKKTAADRDTTFEVVFAAERYNTRANVRMTVHLHITSKKLGQWRTQRTGRKEESGYVLSGSLRRPLKAANAIVWQVAGIQRTESLRAMAAAIGQYLLPVVELFGERERALEQLAAQGGGFTGVCDAESTPLAFMLCFGTQEQAQRFFAHYFNSRPGPWRGNIRKTFALLREGGGMDWDHLAYSGEQDIKLAFAHGLALPEDLASH